MNPNFQIIRLSTSPELKIPSRATAGSAGFDLQANIEKPFYLHAGLGVKIPTGLKIWIRAEHLVGIIVPKSGKGSAGFGVKNLVGVIDSDYQGEIIVNIWNTNLDEPIEIKPFMQIAQIIFLPLVAAVFTEVGVFETGTERGAGGFGSTSGSSSEIIKENTKCPQ